MTITVQPNGSGDTTFNYVQVFCFLVIAAAVALMWAIAGRRRPNEKRLYHWLRAGHLACRLEPDASRSHSSRGRTRRRQCVF